MAKIYYQAILANNNNHQSLPSESASVFQLFQNKRYRLATITMVITRIAQQFSGIFCTVTFGQIILSNVGFRQPDVVLFHLTLCSFVGSIAAVISIIYNIEVGIF